MTVAPATLEALSDSLLLDILDLHCTASWAHERDLGFLRLVSRRWDDLVCRLQKGYESRTLVIAGLCSAPDVLTAAGPALASMRKLQVNPICGPECKNKDPADAFGYTCSPCDPAIWNTILKHFPNLIDLVIGPRAWLHKCDSPVWKAAATHCTKLARLTLQKPLKVFRRPPTFSNEELLAAFAVWRRNGVGGIQRFNAPSFLRDNEYPNLKTLLAIAEHLIDSFEDIWKADEGNWDVHVETKYQLDPSAEELALLIAAYGPTWTVCDEHREFVVSTEALVGFLDSVPNLLRFEATSSAHKPLEMEMFDAPFSEVLSQQCPALQLLLILPLSHGSCDDLSFEESDIAFLAGMPALKEIELHPIPHCVPEDLLILSRSSEKLLRTVGIARCDTGPWVETWYLRNMLRFLIQVSSDEFAMPFCVTLDCGEVDDLLEEQGEEDELDQLSIGELLDQLRTTQTLIESSELDKFDFGATMANALCLDMQNCEFTFSSSSWNVGKQKEKQLAAERRAVLPGRA
ncbi:hypothetical protein HDU86_001495 [Geranomyces michiganensis]|nr:hypothetical protein HDU86_001495 [Geranomyces michiganensis]